MAYPPPYARGYSFQGYQAGAPSSPLPGIKVDTELDTLANVIAALLGFQKLIQRADGTLAIGSIPLDSLDPAFLAQFDTLKSMVSALLAVTNGGSSIPVPVSDLLVTPTGATAQRLLVDRLADTINVKDYGLKCDGTTDDGPALQALVNAVPAGSRIFFPPMASHCLIATPVTVGKTLDICGQGNGSALYVPDATGFIVTAPDVTISDFYVYGNRSGSSSNMLVRTDGAPRFHLRNLRVENLNTLASINGGYFHTIDGVNARNLVQAGLILDQYSGTNGVDCFVTRVTYDTDTGVTLPSAAFVWVKDFDALNLNDFDFIHAGQTAVVWINPQLRRSGDHLIGKGYIDLRPGDGLRIDPASGTHAERINIVGTWFATGLTGIRMTGVGVIDGVRARNSWFYNHQNEAIVYDNTQTVVGGTLEIQGNSFSGNNSVGASKSDINLTGPSNFYAIVKGNIFDDSNALTASRPVHNLQLGSDINALVSHNTVDYSGATAGHVAGLNGDNRRYEDGFRLIQTLTITSSSASAFFNPPDLAAYTELVLCFDGVAHDTSGDLKISFSSDNGVTLGHVSTQRTRYTTSEQDWQYYLTGGRTTAAPIEGSLRIAAVPFGFKHFTYHSGDAAALGDAVMAIGTIEMPAAIAAINLAMSAGLMTTGNFHLYGRP